MSEQTEDRKRIDRILVAVPVSIALLVAGTLGAVPASGPLVERAAAPVLLKGIAEIPACGKHRKLYSVSPVAPSDISYIIPLGNLAPSAHTFPTAHLYLHVRRTVPGDNNTPTVEVPVVAPGPIWITRISSSENLDQGTQDFSLHFSPCAEHEAYFIHLTTLARQLSKQLVGPRSCNEYTTGGERWRQCSKNVHVALAAGEAIGTAGGGLQRNALDLGASDSRVRPSVYASPERWEGRPNQLTLVCALDYFNPSTRRRLRSLLGDERTRRKKKPICGEVAQDVPGTLQGVWFVAGTRELTSEDAHLALVHDNFDPGKGVFSVGISMQRSGLPSATYYFEPATTGARNREFGQVRKRNKVYCYEVKPRFAQATDPVTVILAVLTGPSTLRLERTELSACGSPPWRQGSDYTEFER